MDTRDHTHIEVPTIASSTHGDTACDLCGRPIYRMSAHQCDMRDVRALVASLRERLAGAPDGAGTLPRF